MRLDVRKTKNFISHFRVNYYRGAPTTFMKLMNFKSEVT